MMRLILMTVVIMCCLWTAAGSSGYGTKVGGRREIKDVESNKEVQELGRFSVHEYNRANAPPLLIFSRVVSAESQVVAGIKYYLKIEAKQQQQQQPVEEEEEEERKVFESVVVVQPWLHSKKLLHFSPIQHAAYN